MQAQKQLQEVKQHLSASLTLSPRASGTTHTPHRVGNRKNCSHSVLAVWSVTHCRCGTQPPMHLLVCLCVCVCVCDFCFYL
jgi:hypothetical protein